MRALAMPASVNTALRIVLPFALAACTSVTSSGGAAVVSDCSIPQSLILNGGPGKDGIPALTNPRFLNWELAAETLDGRSPRQLGLHLPGSRRELFEIVPTLGRRAGRGALEVTGLIPVTGRNLPAGAGYSVGYRVHWGGP